MADALSRQYFEGCKSRNDTNFSTDGQGCEWNQDASIHQCALDRALLIDLVEEQNEALRTILDMPDYLLRRKAKPCARRAVMELTPDEMDAKHDEHM